MKTRILHTEFWKKMARYKAPKEARYLYNYLLTNMYINMCGIFELPDEYMLLETALNEKELEKAKVWLTEHNKVYFHDGWVKVAHAEEYNRYSASPKNTSVYERELADVPIEVSQVFDSSIDSSIGVVSGVPDTTPILTINHKSETINQKEGVVKGEEKNYSKIESLTKEDFKEIGDAYEVSSKFVESKYDDMVNWKQSNGKSKSNWKATLRNWVKKDADAYKTWLEKQPKVEYLEDVIAAETTPEQWEAMAVKIGLK